MANAADHSPMGEEAETDTPSGCSSSTPSSTPTTTPTPELFHPRVPPPDRNAALSSRNHYHIWEGSVADPGYGAFLTPGFGMGKTSRSEISDHISESLIFGCGYGIFLTLDPEHCWMVFCLSSGTCRIRTF